MKKLLMFLALWSGAASAMQQDTMPADLASAMPIIQDQIDLAAAKAANRSSVLTSEEQKQAISQAVQSLQRTVKACGNDKELLKITLTERIGKLMKSVFIDNTGECFKQSIRLWDSAWGLYVPLCELVLTVTILYSCLYGINLLTALAVGENVLLTYSPAQVYYGVLRGAMSFGSNVGRWIFTDNIKWIETGSKCIALPLCLSIITLSSKIVSNLFPIQIRMRYWMACKKANNPAAVTAQ